MTTRTQLQILRLNRIATIRLHFSVQWSAVEVGIADDEVYIQWYGAKTRSTGIFHRKSCPVGMLGKLVRQQENKLLNEFRSRHSPGRFRP